MFTCRSHSYISCNLAITKATWRNQWATARQAPRATVNQSPSPVEAPSPSLPAVSPSSPDVNGLDIHPIVPVAAHAHPLSMKSIYLDQHSTSLTSSLSRIHSHVNIMLSFYRTTCTKSGTIATPILNAAALTICSSTNGGAQ